MTKDASGEAALDGEALLTFDLKGPHRREDWDNGKAVIRVLKPKAGGETIYTAEGTYVPHDNLGNQLGPPMTFWFHIPGAADIDDAFARAGDYVNAAGEAFVVRLNRAVEKQRHRIVPATDEPRFQTGRGIGGNGGGSRGRGS